jgi:hypothetical protein
MKDTDKPTEANLAYVARKMRKRAALGVFEGRDGEIWKPYFQSCRRTIFGTTLVFARDTGHHTSGWLKNPDYERCFHLSMSPEPTRLWTPGTPELDKALTEGWVRAFFGEHIDKLWAESPKSPEGRSVGVWHWRLFCDERWTPLLPRGEVYDTEFTELGWKSASELGIEIISTVDPS